MRTAGQSKLEEELCCMHHMTVSLPKADSYPADILSEDPCVSDRPGVIFLRMQKNDGRGERDRRFLSRNAVYSVSRKRR